jgi:3-dehydroquinate synthetase
MPHTRSIPVPLGDRAYEVRIGPGILANLGAWTAALTRGRRAFLIADPNLPSATVATATASLTSAGFTVAPASLRATEPDKSLDSAARLLAEIAEQRLDRLDPVIALGGGIVGDVGGFVAAIYRRGVPIIQCPTTLLSMVDASVGGKTGVNLRTRAPGDAGLKKNLVGAFHQPVLVAADVSTLASLPDRELRCGLAECVKHGLIAAPGDGGALLDWTEAALARILTRDPAALAELVARNVRVKASIVGQDEREDPDKDVRALLNLGHTFGHAIETLPGLSPDGNPAHAPLHHGEAVALGLVAAARCAQNLGLCDKAVGDRLTSLLTRIGLPVRIPGLPEAGTVIAAMRYDKKVLGGRLRLVLPTSSGVRVVDDPGEAAIRAGIAAIRV